jgi:hypothetical protein
MKKILSIIVLLTVCMALMADTAVSGEVKYGFTMGQDETLEQKTDWNVQFQNTVNDYCTATVKIKRDTLVDSVTTTPDAGTDADGDLAEAIDGITLVEGTEGVQLDKALIEIDVLGAVGQADLPASVKLMAGYFDSGPSKVGVVTCMEVEKVTDVKLPKDWVMGVEIGVMDYVTFKVIVDPSLAFGENSDTLGFYVGAVGGIDMIQVEVTATNREAGSGLFFSVAAGFDSGDMLGDLGIEAGVNLGIQSNVGGLDDSMTAWGVGVSASYTSLITVGVDIGGWVLGDVDTNTLSNIGICVTSTPIDLITLGLGVILEMWEDNPSSIGFVEFLLQLNLCGAEVGLGYVYVPEDMAGATPNMGKSDKFIWCHNETGQGGFAVQMKLGF